MVYRVPYISDNNSPKVILEIMNITINVMNNRDFFSMVISCMRSNTLCRAERKPAVTEINNALRDSIIGTIVEERYFAAK